MDINQFKTTMATKAAMKGYSNVSIGVLWVPVNVQDEDGNWIPGPSEGEDYIVQSVEVLVTNQDTGTVVYDQLYPIIDMKWPALHALEDQIIWDYSLALT